MTKNADKHKTAILIGNGLDILQVSITNRYCWYPWHVNIKTLFNELIRLPFYKPTKLLLWVGLDILQVNTPSIEDNINMF